jgi:transposase InsO family protein
MFMVSANEVAVQPLSFISWRTNSRTASRIALTDGARQVPPLVQLTPDGFIWAAVMDLCSRRIVGWAMRDHLRTELPLTVLRMAISAQRPGAVALR